MSDFSLLDEEFERYVIGFTENHFIPSDTNSPTPSDHAIGYNTFALDFAERSNRGEFKNFMDRSFNLDRKKRQSVSKIHTNILDLMSELSERRKLGTPLFSKSAMELNRSDSRSSGLSDASLKTSSSLPMIEVQQLPPLMWSSRSFPSLDHELFGLPDIGAHSKEAGKSQKRSSKKRNEEKLNKGKIILKQNSKGSTRFGNLVQTLKNRKEEESNSLDLENKNVTEIEGKETDSRNVHFIVGTAGKENEAEKNDARETSESSETSEARNKWKTIYEKLKEAMDVVKERGDSFNAYKGRYYTNSSDATVRKMSFCQSSYKERTDRERMNNIRRRHSCQTNVGPLDFNKLRRQITIGKSRTMFAK